MTNAEAISILNMLPSEVHDITVVTTDGKRATADVIYSRNGGDLITARVEFTVADKGAWHHLSVPDNFPEHLVQEVVDECREACLYQRDLNRARN